MKIKSKEKLSEILHKNKNVVLSFRDAALDITFGRKGKYLDDNFDLLIKDNNIEVKSVKYNKVLSLNFEDVYIAFQDRFPQDLPGHEGMFVIGSGKNYLTIIYKTNTQVFIWINLTFFSFVIKFSIISRKFL